MRNWAKTLQQYFNPRRSAIRSRILRDPYYRLTSWEEVDIAVQVGLNIEVNRATVDDWLRLPGLSIHQARSLVELNAMGVSFVCCEDIAAAVNIPLTHLQRLEPLLLFTFYDTNSLESPFTVNPNTATLEQLNKIPVMTSELAEKLILNRQEKGKYRNLADLQQRLTLDSAFITQLMHYFRWS